MSSDETAPTPPGTVEEDVEEPPAKVPDSGGRGGAVVKAAGDVTELCLGAMEGGLKKIDDKVPDESCCKKPLKCCLGFKDPVQVRCSVGRIVFFVLFLTGIAFAVIEFAAYDYWAEMAGAIFVALMALFVMIFLGGDLFMFEAFKAVVNAMEKQIKKLRTSLNFYEDKLKELSTVSAGLESVYEQMSGDEKAVANLLTDMERLGKLQTVAAVVNQFYAADYDGSGHISGEEADLLFPQITILWELVPSFDRSKVVEHVRASGLTIGQLALILDALVEEDEAACMKALDALCSGEAAAVADTEAPQRTSADLAEAPAHGRAFIDLEAGVVDAEAPSHALGGSKLKDALHSMAPPDASTEDPSGDGEEDVMKPMFTLPTPFPTRMIGPVTIGGKCSVWGVWHLAALICVPISLTFLILVLIGLEVHHIVLNTVGFCLAAGLTGAGKLIEVLRHLRRQAKEFKEENVRLEGLNHELANNVSKLQKLKLGFDKLQELCAGNVVKAKELLKKSETKIKMEAMAFVTHLFKHSDLNRNMKLEAQEKETFFANFEKVMSKIPGFDMVAIRNAVGEGDLTRENIKQIIDVVATFGHEEEAASALPLPPTATQPAEGPSLESEPA